MSIGPYLGSFNEAYLRSAELGRRQQRDDLQEAMTLESIRQQAQEQADMGILASAFQARQRALQAQPPPPPPPPPSAPPAAPMPEQLAGPPPDTAPMPPTPVSPAMAQPGEPERRQGLLESLDPRMAGRLLSSGRGRSAIKDLETAEKEHETQENKKQAEGILSEATAALKAGDTLSYYDHAAKAMRVLGNHQAAAQYLEHSVNLRADQKEETAANEDLGRWLKAKSQYDNDPTPEHYATFLESLGEANSKTSRALRLQITGNVIGKTFNQNPKVTGFSRSIASAYRDAFADGKEPNAEQIFKATATKDPEGFNAYVYDALENGKNLPAVVLKKVLRWEEEKDIPKDISMKAFVRTRAKYPDLKTNDPRFMELWWQDEVRMTRELDKAKGEGDADKNVRADVSEVRRRLSDVRAELRRNPGMSEEDPERYRDLREEERQAVSDLKFQESRLRKSTGAPEAKPQDVQIPVKAPSPKFKPGDEKYRAAAKAEMGRLSQAGYTREQVLEMMRKNGWR